MNSIILMGRLVKDPEIKVTPSEKMVCTFTLAVERPFAKKEADFINIVAWGKTAEVVGNYVQKGQRLLVEGRLQIRNYDAKSLFFLTNSIRFHTIAPKIRQQDSG